LSKLVGDLLEVSRITNGKIILRKEPVLIAAVVYEAVESVRPLIEHRRQTIEVQMPSDPGRVVVDPGRIAQVLENLLTNASKYSPHGGPIRVSVDLEDELVRICVIDRGVGLPAEFIPRLFTLFTQAEHTIDRAEGGLGVGLALAKRLVELHGGTVSAESPGTGQGSTFCVRLPRAQRDAATASVPGADPGAPATAASRRLAVLVVDDNRDAADTLSMLLTDQGHSVQTAYEGQGALKAAAVEPPDIAILDIGLPGMDGYQLARELVELPGCERVLLVALSGYGQPADRHRSREAGFVYHLVKPADFDELHRIFELAADGRG
jgi:CheY-like chemotaxis protein/anti-sigma regulatory factor (Ser/Thr protein kinase)